MGYYKTPNHYYTAASQGFGTGYTVSDSVISFVKSKLEKAGWATQEEISAQISLSALAFATGVQVIIAGIKYVFYQPPDPPPTDGIPVIIGSSTTESLINLGGALVGSQSGSVDGNTITITGLKNSDLCQIIPSGGFALWSSSTGVTGEGFAYGGGWAMNSSPINGTTLDIKFYSTNTAGQFVLEDRFGLGGWSGAVFINQSWSIAASPYQYILWRDATSSGDAAGSLFIGSNLHPIGLTEYAQFMCGPVHTNVGPEGGNRDNFAGITRRWYFRSRIQGGTNHEYVAAAGSNTEQLPVLVYPGFGFGRTSIDHLGNKAGAADIPILDDTGKAFPFDAFLAVCESDPTLNADERPKIFGAFWDSAIFSKVAALDSSCKLDGLVGMVVLAQHANSDRSCGSFGVRIEKGDDPIP